jgi:glycogen phosphorylase
MGVPVVGIGLLYQQGYFRQMIDAGGGQEALFPYNDPFQLPITPLREKDGEWLRLKVMLPGHAVWLRAWQVQVGKVRLYLLDTNDAANFPAHRGITSELYGGGLDLRFKQELVLGIGGWRLLEAMGIAPEVCHLNEGHAAFAVLERCRSFMKKTGLSFREALAATRAGNIFTTHTAVDAGFDRFPPALVERYLGNYARTQLGIEPHELLALGRKNPDDASESFNMAWLALHGCGSANAVSELHGKVSRRLFASAFPRWPEEEVPVGHVTNGVHMPTWDSEAADSFWTEACGKHRWLGDHETLERDIRRTSDKDVWKLRTTGRAALVDYVRERLSLQLAGRGEPAESIEAAKQAFDPAVLTLGFARRFATYKRPNLLLHDPDRLLRLLTNRERPVQLIVAGKAHPADEPGKALIREWMRFIQRPGVREHVMFLSDYDMHLTEHLVQGVDVWINTPRRPWEACGTSGMKVLVNGGLNLSELDGWWVEAYSPEVGWALGDGQEHDSDPAWDAREAGELYDLLENHVIPEFYARDGNGIPKAWIAKIRESMARLTPQFSASRAVRDYTEKHYLPAAAAYRRRTAEAAAAARAIAEWQREIEAHWGELSFGEVKAETIGDEQRILVEVSLGALNPASVRIELYAVGSESAAPVRLEMMRERRKASKSSASDGAALYRAALPASRPASDYTPRAVPHFAGVEVPLEENRILWQR